MTAQGVTGEVMVAGLARQDKYWEIMKIMKLQSFYLLVEGKEVNVDVTGQGEVVG